MQLEHGSPRERAKRHLPIHPLLFAAYPVLTLFAVNAGLTPVSGVVRPLLVCLGAVATLWLLASVVFRSAMRGAAFTSVVTVLFFDYSHLKPYVRETIFKVGIPWWQVEPRFPAIWGALAVALALLVSSKRFNPVKVMGLLNLFGAVLVGVALWQTASTLRSSGTSGAIVPASLQQITPPPAGPKPDVFFIVLDSYGRDDALRKYINLDNSKFLDALRQRGFYIATNARSNHNQTHLSLASALNLNYLDEAFAARPGLKKTKYNCSQIIDANAAADYFRALGYAYVFVPTDFPFFGGRTADYKLDQKLGGLTAFEDALIGLTPIPPQTKGAASIPENKRQSIRSAFKHVANLGVKSIKPKFVFAHIMAPHPPFVFAADGSAVEPIDPTSVDGAHWMTLPGATPAKYREGYSNLLLHTNKLLLEAIDAILEKAQVPPIIIVQGDHGSKVAHNYEQLTPDSIEETFPILSAFYAPEGVTRKLYPSISPVNNFRAVLAGAFGQDLDLLPDRSFYSPYDKPFEMTEVTERIPLASSEKGTGGRENADETATARVAATATPGSRGRE